ncbi:SPBc2 prophage-derived uncharacterized HTH-type transcriptional regulator YonR [Lentibacillus sp. JNUCC-1]|uniref:helix-turn-helix domain-containing protein n=1 Tax=Lentibacillus sp. JNUCC-1 TaxID=2654513 RepID=UPI0012E87AC1|nr:helix-turn-helix transcriptional regulator [Lentibacillus sp. JNUCC-1]MUV38256.1 SPBc2 prophage-derived uncharacterized HTH-type transcriptional regulator YonR [Lentibacillus sp. JNUCC-1]
MRFGEKLFKLRKEKGLSQEALAEDLNTTRQAISKWENGQGFPETEKLLKMSYIFEVSTDYLLKDTTEKTQAHDKGYYVSKEMAEGYLMNQKKLARFMPFGVSLFILFAFFARVPYKAITEDAQSMEIYSFLIIIFGALGIGLLATSEFFREDQYKVLKQEVLLLDENYHKELQARYSDLKKKYHPIMAVGIGLVLIGMIAFFLQRKDINPKIFQDYYPVFVALIAIGGYILTRASTVLEAYKLLVHNADHTNKLSFKFMRGVKKRVDKF